MDIFKKIIEIFNTIIFVNVVSRAFFAAGAAARDAEHAQHSPSAAAAGM